jgi:hypothetical protein
MDGKAQIHGGVLYGVVCSAKCTLGEWLKPQQTSTTRICSGRDLNLELLIKKLGV